MIQEQNRGEPNEKVLYHGSMFVPTIVDVEIGFDVCLSTKTGYLGADLYFTENASKSNIYVFGDTSAECPKQKDATSALGECTHGAEQYIVQNF